jgi:glutathione synthase/RimK-type ligase-like ATP-grasp enzyme
MTTTSTPRRPTPTIALLTCRHHDHIDHASEGRLMQELVRQGAIVTLAAWDDVLTPLKAQDGEPVIPIVYANRYVLRTTWDYWDRLDAFTHFVEKMEDGLLNTRKTVLNNLNKAYLTKLEAAGVPIVPTVFVQRGEGAAAIDQAKRNNWSSLIIKPAIAAAAVGLRKFDHADDAADYLTELTRTGGALVQPYLPRITTEGETSLVYFDGRFSHAVTKLPAPGDFRSQVDFGGAYTLVEPTEAQLHVAELALTAWEARYGDKPLYARVDLVPGHDGQPLLGELELIEPELFLDMAEHAAEMFASAILARVTQPAYTPTPWWKNLLVGTGCFLVFVAMTVIFAAGVGAIFGLIFGGP